MADKSPTRLKNATLVPGAKDRKLTQLNLATAAVTILGELTVNFSTVERAVKNADFFAVKLLLSSSVL